jgi:hypothetical protein
MSSVKKVKEWIDKHAAVIVSRSPLPQSNYRRGTMPARHSDGFFRQSVLAKLREIYAIHPLAGFYAIYHSQAKKRLT